MRARLLRLVEKIHLDGHVRLLMGPSLISLVVKLLSAALTYLMFVALARVMSVAEFGKFSFEFNLATFLCFVAGFGLHNAILRWLPEYEVADDVERQRSVFTWSLYVTLAGSAVVILLMAAFDALGGWRAVLNFEFSLSSMFLVIPLAYAELVSASLRSKGSIIWSLLPKDVVWRILVIGAAACLMFQGWVTFSEFAIAYLTVSLSILVAIQLAVFHRRLGGFVFVLSVPRSVRKAWTRTAIPIWLAGILISLTTYIDVVLVGILTGPTETAIYFTAARTANLMTLLLAASNMVFAPLISRFIHSGDRVGLQRLLSLNALGIGIPTLAAYLVILLFGRTLLGFFHSEFVAGYTSLVILGAGYLINALCGPMSYVMQIGGLERQYLRIMAVSYAGVLAFQLATVPYLGAEGVALGSALGFVVWNLWSRHVAIKRLGIDPTILGLRGAIWRRLRRG